MTGRFEGRRALVSGGAGGIGLEVARVLAEGGATVALLDRDPDALVRAAEGTGFATVAADVRDPEQVADAIASVGEALGGPADILVNAAGIYRVTPMTELGVEEWDEVIAINLRGPWLVARAFVRALIAGGGAGGSIVNISSTAGLIADPAEPAAHYDASKAGVLAITRAMATEWAKHGIRANAVCPGVIDTPMLRMMDDPEAGRAYLDARVPLRRLGMPREVATAIAFLASDEAAYITGVAIPVDGGTTAT